MTATQGTSPGHAWSFIQRRMVNAGARLQEIANGRGPFRWGQARRVVIYAEAVHGRAYMLDHHDSRMSGPAAAKEAK
jgi:hypothetical protein